MHKDMRLAGELGAGELPLLATVTNCLARAEKSGIADDDLSSLIHLLELTG